MTAARAIALALLAGTAAPLRAADSRPQVSVAVDPRVELVGVVQRLAPASTDPADFARSRSTYALEAVSFFAGRAGSPAVALSSSAAARAFKYSDRMQVALRLSPPPELGYRLERLYALDERAGGREALDRWLSALRDFARAGRFDAFFAQKAGLLSPAVEDFRAREAKTAFLPKIEDYAGLELEGSYCVFLSPFAAAGGVANGVTELPDGRMEITSVIGADGGPDAPLSFWGARVPGVLWHEAGHGVVDALGDLWEPEILRSSAAYAGLPWPCYNEWHQCVKEHVVRAVMIRLIAREVGEDAAREQLAYEDPGKFPYLEPMLAALKRYEGARRRYPTLADFYPELLKVLPPPPAGTPLAGEPAWGRLSPAKQAHLRLVLAQILAHGRQKEVLARARRDDAALAAAASAVPASQASAAAPAAAAPAPALPAKRRKLLARAEKARSEGVEAFGRGDAKAALSRFDEALKAVPDDAETLVDRAVALDALGRLDEAVDAGGKAVAAAEAAYQTERTELLPSALSSRASLYLKQGRKDLALADLRRAYELAPEAWPLRAETKQRLSQLGAP